MLMSLAWLVVTYIEPLALGKITTRFVSLKSYFMLLLSYRLSVLDSASYLLCT